LEFDQDLRVQRLSFNGATVALVEYRNGRLSTLNRVDSYDSIEQRLYYDSRGRLARVVEDDEIVARYGYDNFDRVIYAMDASSGYSGSYGSHGHAPSKHARPEYGGAARRYRFDARGHLSGLSMNDVSLGFRANRFGMVERVTWAENSAMDIAYADTDRVQALHYDVDDVNLGSEYEYDEGGFRVSGRYDVLEGLGATSVAFDYDSTGNLIRLEMPGREGTTRVMQHTIGSENQLLRLTPLGAEAFEQAIEYDQSGRAVRSMQGGQREAAFRYDELGRLTDVYLDREHVLTSSHGPMDIDPVHASDDYSAFTATGDPIASAVFGSLDEIVYTRPFGTPYGVVRFVPEMARFVILEHPVVPPDSVLLASLRRRNLASEDTLNPSPLLGFDKPSSSLFVPPEFFTSNCSGCIGGVSGFDVDRVGSGLIVTGQTINFEADGALEYCYYWYLDGYEISEIPYDFHHNVAFLGGGGSGPGTFWSPFAYAQFSGSYSTPGTKTVQDTLTCSCGNIFLAQAQEQVEVVCPVPTNFRQTFNLGYGGLLHFEYAWDSSTGNHADLAACTVGESVTYPNGNPYVAPNPPFNAAYSNPTEINVAATQGSIPDDHMIPGFTTPYSPSSHTGTQNWRYSCPCANNGQFVNLMGPLSIRRQVSQNPNGSWKYTITKPTAGFATIDPLP
jgi:YD repeat-containing protein